MESEGPGRSRPGRDPICAKGPGKAIRLQRGLLAALGIPALVAASWLAIRQHDLLDQDRLRDAPEAAARLLCESQRYGPGDPAVFEVLLREDGPELSDRIFAEAIRLAPTWAAFRYARGLVLLRTGEFDEAERSFETARRLAPHFSGLAERIGAAWVREARARGEPKLLLYAFPRLRQAAEIDPSSLRRSFRLISSYVPDPRVLAKLVPEGAPARGAFGVLLLEEGHPAEAIPELSFALEGTPDADGTLRLARGRAQLATGEVEGARRDLLAAVRASYRPDDLLRSLYDDFAAAGRKDEGLELWRALADRYPRGARFNLGRHYFEQGERHYKESFAEFEEVWRRRSRVDPATAGYLARIELAWELYRDARARLEHTLWGAPRDADLHYLLALAFRGQRRDAQAMKELERAQELFPSNDLYPRLLEQWRGR